MGMELWVPLSPLEWLGTTWDCDPFFLLLICATLTIKQFLLLNCTALNAEYSPCLWCEAPGFCPVSDKSSWLVQLAGLTESHNFEHGTICMSIRWVSWCFLIWCAQSLGAVGCTYMREKPSGGFLEHRSELWFPKQAAYQNWTVAVIARSPPKSHSVKLETIWMPFRCMNVMELLFLCVYMTWDCDPPFSSPAAQHWVKPSARRWSVSWNFRFVAKTVSVCSWPGINAESGKLSNRPLEEIAEVGGDCHESPRADLICMTYRFVFSAAVLFLFSLHENKLSDICHFSSWIAPR